ncbi:hypothetical protein [Plantactinospora sp. BC1]|uniref:hypothetical protein n=1 Tax=Plantactinospora sp. BC1 TaxID=2108470 RepID=UPI00131EFC4B|nr:hypothetical protein [Plantactinospora sp. BC1]
MTGRITALLEEAYDTALVKELLLAYDEAKRNFYLGGHRLSAVEGGRFCEAAYRILELRTKGAFTPIGEVLDTEKVAKQLSGLPSSGFPKSLRIYIPRALRVVYDIRNSRDAAHLADGVDPNLQDATLVVSILDWVLAEFVRLGAGSSSKDIQAMIDGLVTRQIPVVQIFGRYPKVLRTDLRAGEFVLVLLYHAGAAGVPIPDLLAWIPSSMRANLRRTLRTLETKALVHLDGEVALITYAGQRVVEAKRLFDPPVTETAIPS